MTFRLRPLLALCAYIGAAATAGMFFLDGDRYLLGGLLLVVANSSLAVSMVLYNAYRIVRQDAGDPDARRALYFVQRPDGSECCRETSWRMVERIIRRDMRASNDIARMFN